MLATRKTIPSGVGFCPLLSVTTAAMAANGKKGAKVSHMMECERNAREKRGWAWVIEAENDGAGCTPAKWTPAQPTQPSRNRCA